MKSSKNILQRIFEPLIGGDYGYDAGFFGRLVQFAKRQGNANNIKGEFKVNMSELYKLNPNLIQQHLNYHNLGQYFAEPWTVDMMKSSLGGIPVGKLPNIKKGVHAYYARSVQLTPQSGEIGSPFFH